MKMFSDFKNEFNNSEVKNKWDFAKKAMEQYHLCLWDYARAIKETDISCIEIRDNRVGAEIGNVKLICREYDSRSMPMDILNFNHYENTYMDMICKLLEAIDVSVMLDVGANIGYTSCFLGKRFPKALLYAYEPIESTFKILTSNVCLNSLENIKCFNVGLSDENRSQKFYFYPWCTANTSLKNLQESGDAILEECEIWRLDDRDEIKNISVDYLKCDVEGNELNVLLGGKKIIKDNLPMISIEILRKFSQKFGYEANDVAKEILQYGYRMFIEKNEGVEEIYSITQETEETNFIFLHRDKHKEVINKFVRK